MQEAFTNFLFIVWSVVCVALLVSLVIGATRMAFHRRETNDSS